MEFHDMSHEADSHACKTADSGLAKDWLDV